MEYKVNLINELLGYLKNYESIHLDILTDRVRQQVLDIAFPNRGWEFDGSHLQLDPDGNYRLRYGIWDLSYHNGDTYNHRQHYSLLTQEIADLILADLESQYEDKETKRLVEEHKTEIENVCRSKVVPAMQRFN